MNSRRKDGMLGKRNLLLRGITIASPGGIGGGGGIGTVTRTIRDWLELHHPELEVAVIDPRGTGSANRTIFYLPKAMAQLVWLRAFRGHSILHLQVSERLSFLRKGLLLGLGRIMGMHIVLHHHGAELIEFWKSASPAARKLVKWSASNADLNIVLGDLWKKFLIEDVAVKEESIEVHVNAAFDSGPGTSTNIIPWRYMVIANLSPRKGISELLSSVAQIAAAGKPVELTLIGGGEIERYKKEAQVLGIDNICIFTGWIASAHVTTYLRSGSSLVLPSHNEGLPMAILEALSMNVPIITTAVGSIGDHLTHDLNCIFVEPGSIEQITEALTAVAEDEKLRVRITDHGRALFEERFSIDKYMRRMLQRYQNLNDAANS